MPRARLEAGDGKTVEWKSKGLRAYQRRTMAADALIASVYLAGTNTRRVRRALAALFGGAIGKDIVSRTWRKVKTDWDAWNARSLADEPIVRLILDGTVVCVRLDRKASAISCLLFGREVGRHTVELTRTVYQERAPNNALYDKSAKRYVASPQFSPIFLRPDPDGYLSRLAEQRRDKAEAVGGRADSVQAAFAVLEEIGLGRPSHGLCRCSPREHDERESHWQEMVTPAGSAREEFRAGRKEPDHRFRAG